MSRRMVAYFTYYGSRTSKDKDVILSQESDDSCIVTVEGYPELTKGSLSYETGIELLEAYKEMSLKDWGSSEIYYSRRSGEYGDRN